MQDETSPVNLVTFQAEQVDDVIKKQLMSLPQQLSKVQKVNAQDLHIQDALFLFVGYAKMLFLYDRYFFPQNPYAFNAQVKNYWNIVRRFKDRNISEVILEKALQCINEKNNHEKILDVCILEMNFLKSADIKNKINQHNLNYYAAIVDALEIRIDIIVGKSHQADFSNDLMGRLQDVKSKELCHSPDSMEIEVLFERCLCNPSKNTETVEKIYDRLTDDQIITLGQELYLEHYKVSLEMGEFIRCSEICSIAMINYLVDDNISLLPLYESELIFEKSFLRDILEQNLADNLVAELSLKKPAKLRAYFVCDSLKAKTLSEIVLLNPVCYSKLFLDIRQEQVREEVRKVCENSLFREMVQKADSELNKWFHRLPDKFMVDEAFSSLRRKPTTWGTFQGMGGKFFGSGSSASPARRQKEVQVVFREKNPQNAGDLSPTEEGTRVSY